MLEEIAKMRQVEQHYEVVAIDSIRHHPRNARRGDVGRIRESVRGNGFYGAVVVQKSTRQILVGNHRFEAAKAEGADSLPVIWADVDDATAAKIMLADNRTGELGTYDDQALLSLLLEIPRQEITETGFDIDELDELIRKVNASTDIEEAQDADEAPEVPPDPVSKLGEIYQLGPHRLICGDSTIPETWSALMAGQVAEMLWCDPPYGVKYEGKTKDKLKIQNDDLPPDQLGQFIRAALEAACGVLKPGGSMYVAGPSSPLGVEFKRTMIEMGVLRQELQWVKDVFVMGRSDYHYRHEPIFYGWKVGASHRWYGGRAQDSILNCPRPHRSKVHPTMKPTALIRRCIENNSRLGEVVIDGFGGSGSTLIASALCGREARLVELDPGYCDVIRTRWTRWAIAHQQEPGEGAIL